MAGGGEEGVCRNAPVVGDGDGGGGVRPRHDAVLREGRCGPDGDELVVPEPAGGAAVDTVTGGQHHLHQAEGGGLVLAQHGRRLRGESVGRGRNRISG